MWSNRDMKIYLAGSVPKGDKEASGYKDWRKEYAALLAESTEV
jgi:hypothetical protein